MSSHRLTRRRVLAVAVTNAVALFAHQTAEAAENPTEALELPTVEVIGTTPLPGLGTAVRDVPANVQIYTGKDVRQQRQSNIGEYLEQNPNSVTINSGQGNPFQADVNFRGFTASPLLGTPQGLSVFQDGVRINEPFGDVVNWDFLPPSAISSIQLIPGSNPAFGLNTLGGALAVYTKSGSQYPGGSIEAYGGSFGRKGAEIEYGGKHDKLDYFVTGNYMKDDGWAEHNASTVQQFFGKVGWQDEKTDFDVSLTAADNTLEGTQTLPVSWFDTIRAAYTWPDLNKNKLTFLTAKGSRFLSDSVILGGNAYYRKYKNENISSNVNNNYDPTDPASIQATNDSSRIDQDSYGLGLQLTWLGKLSAMDNQFSLGASGDFGKARFTQASQDAAITPDRSAIGISDFIQQTSALTRNAYYGLFFTDTLKLDPRWTLTAAGRYNRARVKIEDQSGTAPELNGDHTFSRFNPAVGINFNPSERLTAYAAYNEGTRAPSPIELTCADPAAPCKLPNNFVSDPPLKMVVSKTMEAGLRGSVSKDTTWSAAVYRTELTDDIQFISSNGANNAGFFQNVGKTRRQGIELSLGNKLGALTAMLNYSYVDATFRSPFTVSSPSNSAAAVNGDIQVQPGNRVPGIPRQSVKLRLQYDFDEQASLGMNINYSGSVYARGDESNQDVNGQVPGYTVVNLDGRYRIAKGTEVFIRVTNLFDRKYANFGNLGENFFTGPDRTFDGANPVKEQFRGPGVPRGGWIGLRYQWL
jgi:iron complex outermembrane receptor protein